MTRRTRSSPDLVRQFAGYRLQRLADRIGGLEAFVRWTHSVEGAGEQSPECSVQSGKSVELVGVHSNSVQPLFGG